MKYANRFINLTSQNLRFCTVMQRFSESPAAKGYLAVKNIDNNCLEVLIGGYKFILYPNFLPHENKIIYEVFYGLFDLAVVGNWLYEGYSELSFVISGDGRVAFLTEKSDYGNSNFLLMGLLNKPDEIDIATSLMYQLELFATKRPIA